MTQGTGNEGLSATLGLLNSFVQFLDAKSSLVERRHHGDKIMHILKFEPLPGFRAKYSLTSDVC